MSRTPKQKIFHKIIVDGKILDVFPGFPVDYRCLLSLKGISLVLSNQSEYESFIAREFLLSVSEDFHETV